MKTLITFLAPAILIAAPAFADEDAQLNDALVTAGRKALSVAPWVKLTVGEVKVDDKLRWTLKASTGQPYACVADADVDALTSGKVVCARAELSAEEIAARNALSDARAAAPRRNQAEAALSQSRSTDLMSAPGVSAAARAAASR